MKDIKPLNSVSANSAKPFAFATQAQYQRYIDCLDREGLTGISVVGGFTSDQLKCAIKAMGTCPPGYQSKCSGLYQSIGYDTPIINPAPGFNPTGDYNSAEFATDSGKKLSSGKGRRLSFHRGRYVSTYGNDSGPSQAAMTGFNFMPATFKDKTKTFIDPKQYGFEAEILPGRFVSATHQRVTGGKIVPLKEPLQVISRQPRTIKNINLPDEDWVNVLRNLQNINQTTKGTLVTPPKISGIANINGKPIQNIKATADYLGYPLDEVVWPGPDGDSSTTNATGTTGTNAGATGTNAGATNTAASVTANVPNTYNDASASSQTSSAYAPYDSENIRYNPFPVVDITPLEMASNGNYFNGGPTARAQLKAPTPEATINQQDLMGIPANSELIINGKKIIIRGVDLADIKTQVNCAKAGVVAELTPGDVSGGAGGTLTISSCDGAPWSVANGCGGGTYKQVGDFHINRGFEQQKNYTRTLSNTIVIAPSRISGSFRGTFNKDNSGSQSGSTRQVPLYPENGGKTRYWQYDKDPETGLYLLPTNEDGDPDLNNPLTQASFRSPAIVPMETNSNQSTYTVGGSGYRIGDRLRLVGGTPVNNSTGPFTKICIDSAGAGYTNPANLQIIINSEGDTPGIGAAATVTRLDELGGIAEIEMISYGGGYDINKPPTVEIYDSTSSSQMTATTVLAAWTADATTGAPISISGGATVQIEAQRKIYDNNHEWDGIEISHRYVRAARPVTFGNTNSAYMQINSSEGGVAWADPAISSTYLPNRTQIQIDTTVGTWAESLRPNSEVEIIHFPMSLFHTSNIALQAGLSDGANLVIDYDATLWNNILSFGGHHVAVYADTNSDGNVELIGHAGYTYANTNGGTNIDFGQFELTAVFDTDGAPSSGWAGTLSSGTDVFISVARATRFWIPEPVNATDGVIFDNKFIIEDPVFTTALKVASIFQAHTDIRITTTTPWWTELLPANGTTPALVDTIDPRIPRVSAKLSAMIGMDPNINYSLDSGARSDEANLLDRSIAGPLRIAKFIVTGVDADGAITAIRVIDRGLYTVFPSDLTYGLPLEYDYEPQGFAKIIPGENTVSLNNRLKSLGVVDPLRQNTEYGSESHPEYLGVPFVNSKHPDWATYPEFWYDGTTYQPYSGSPGAYDPSSFVIVNTAGVGSNPIAAEQAGLLLRKQYDIETDPGSLRYGRYSGDVDGDEILTTPGGTGARLFLTSQEVPNCTEKGRAKENLALPDLVTEINAPNALARTLNNALSGAGYSPTDLSFKVDDFGDIGVIRVETDFPGLNLDSPTPGILEKIGLPSGDYNLGMLCTEAVLENPDLTDSEALEVVKSLYESGGFGIITDPDKLQELTGTPREFTNPTAIINMLCVERMGPGDGGGGEPPGGKDDPETYGFPVSGPASRPRATSGPYPLNDNNSIFHDGKPQVYAELYKYQLTNIFGEAIKMNGSQKQNAPVNIFESKRFNDSNPIDILLSTTTDITTTTGEGLPSVYTEANAWVDDYRGIGWAYLENGQIKSHQEDLVDTQFIDNALVYDPETGTKVSQLDFWDPFKGILPGFIRNEIHYITEQDPVSYKNDRTVFGRNNVGKVWWDTSTIRYEWYEQGSNTERRNKWGKAFPGSSVTVCEWVESKSLPANWAGNGIPRWRDRYVTERHRDDRTGEYQLYYYYWVQNRKLVDDRLKEKWNRKFDTQTLARYIANPAGYGLEMISFVSDNSFVLANPGQYISDKDSHVQINVSRNSNPDSLNHTAWKLMREGDNNSEVPDHLTAKLIDSLSGINAIGEVVPDPRLSVVEAYGISFRPRQSMFQNIKEARRVAVRVINELLADIKLNTQHPEWDSALPATRSYIQTVNWYAVDKYDPVTNMAVRYDSSYKPVTKVPSVTELYKLKNLSDGTVIKVASAQNNTSQLWLYSSNQDDFKLISIANETVQLSDAVYTDITNPALSLELRTFLITMSQQVLNQGSEKWNTVFFELLKYAYMEQAQLSWAFKTSYLYVEKQEDDLVQFKGFKPDNFQKVLDYMNEVKPFNAKIREYKDGKTAPMEIIGQNNISDYDKPPYVDTVTGEVRILDDFLQEDYDIMRNNARYIDYLSVSNKSQDPIRRANTTLVFDRTNWRLTEFDWNASSTPVNLSIATNIAALTQMTGAEVEAATTSRAVDRIFKFAPAVRAAFALEVNTYFNSPTAYSNADIVGNVTQMYDIIEAGSLNSTLALVKEAVGGNFRGETLDGKQFTTIMQNIDYMANAAVEFGFDTVSWDENTDNDVTVFTDSRDEENYGNVTSIGIGDVQWDSTLELVSYQGVFNTETQGNVTLRRNDETYEGFDGVTFQRVLYGEERPEEMALFDPLETLVMTVTTSEFARGSILTNTIYDEFDLANSTLYYQAVSAANVTIINPGAGYVNPSVTFFDDGELRTPAAINTPITVATGNAVVDANGLITAIDIVDAGSGYVSIGVRVSETLSAFTAAEGVRGINELILTSTNNARVGQRVTYSGNNLGVITSIDGTMLMLDRGLPLTVPNAIEVSLIGQDFVGAVETANVTLAGPDADLTAVYFVQNSVTGWDSANIAGEAGAFDVDRETAQEVVSIKVAPQAQAVIYRTHMNLFGGTDYLRIASPTTTTLVEDFGLWDTEIQVNDSSFMPYPTTLQPGTLWIGSERINYARRNGNTLSLITRGVLGTTIEDHAAGDEVYSAEAGNTFNDQNPRGNIWLDLGTKYNTPSAWSEVEAGIDGVLGNTDDIIHAWDELANGNITVSTVSANIIDANSTTSNITLLSSMTLTVDEAVRITHASNVNLTEVVKVTNIDGNNVTVEASYFGTLDANLFVANSTVQFSSFDYGTQASEDAWDAAVISGQSALSLADRANIDFSANTSIMRFLHNL